jgi:hypothetical protein
VREEAIYNPLCIAETMSGYREAKVEALPLSFLPEKESIPGKSNHNQENHEHN